MRVEELDGEVLPVIGEVAEALWEAVSGGQPVALTRRGRAAAVLVDAETYAEMVRAAHFSEGGS
jgi:prevent-host-death family protein